jgi:hypothetical protein
MIFIYKLQMGKKEPHYNFFYELCITFILRPVKDIRKENFSQAQVAPTCNPSYSGGRDQEALGSGGSQP